MRDDDEDDALAIREPAPPVRMASSLESADHRSIVHVDGKGQVRSPARYRLFHGIVTFTLGLGAVGAPLVYGATMGPVGFFFGLFVSVAAGRSIWMIRNAQRAMHLLVEDRLDEAQALWEPMLTRRFGGRAFKASILQNLGTVAFLRGDHAQALRLMEEAHAMRNPRGQRALLGLLGSYTRVTLHVNRGHLDDATRLLASLPQPTGDYLALLHDTAELYVAFARGSHGLDVDTLHQRAHVGLTVTNADTLLALSAWAFLQLGDEDQGLHLLREALDRQRFSRMQRTHPSLHAWMMEQAPRARVDVT